MARLLLVICCGCFLEAAVEAADTPKRKELPPQVAAFLQLDGKAFIARFDTNKDGFLSKDELPGRFKQAFERADRNGDGKLDAAEIDQLLATVRQRFGSNDTPAPKPDAAKPDAAKPAKGTNPGPTAGPMVEKLVEMMLNRQDTNKDGKISKGEAQGQLAANFEKIDTNKDGYLDKDELRESAKRGLAALRDGRGKGDGRPGTKPLDFDSLDADTDGRLTKDEVKGTPFAEHFDEIDTNKDGKIDPKEFAAYQKKHADAGE